MMYFHIFMISILENTYQFCVQKLFPWPLPLQRLAVYLALNMNSGFKHWDMASGSELDSV